MTETEELLADWKAVYGEQNPNRDPEFMQYTAAMLAGFTLMRREIRLAAKAAPPDSDQENPKSFKPRGRILHGLGKYNWESE